MPLNIAEGTGEHSLPDRRRFWTHARGSAFESGACLDVAQVEQIVEPPTHAQAKDLLERIVSMLTKMTT